MIAAEAVLGTRRGRNDAPGENVMVRVVGALMILALVLLAGWWPSLGSTAKGFPGGRAVSEGFSVLTGGGKLPAFEGAPAVPRPLPPLPMPAHPVMNNHGYAGAHGDSYNSGVLPHPGPLGRATEVHSRMAGRSFSGCSTQHFDPRGRVVTVCVGFRSTKLLLLDPRRLEVLAIQELPAFAGWYFRMDPQGSVYVPAGDMSIRIFAVDDSGTKPRWVQRERIDLNAAVPVAERDSRTFPMDLLADWQGNWWFGFRSPAVLGYRDTTGKLHTHRLEGEELENGLASSERGVFFVTDQHLYGLRAGADGPEVILKLPYDSGGGANAISKGSGTTPTLFAEHLIAFGDNASPRPNVLVYRLDDVADDERLVCKIPVFEEDRAALENSFIGYDHSLIIENNKGFEVFGDSSAGEPGLVRIDVERDLSGCHTVWYNREVRSGSGAKLSTANGLIYVHELLAHTGWVNAWYLSAIDFRTGELRWRRYLGSGKQWDNAMLTLSIGPDGLLTSGMFAGVAGVRDGQSD
jgi:hypothetical protein